MDAKKRLDKILAAVQDQVKNEIGVLLGVEFSLGDARCTLIGKTKFFAGLAGKQILARIDLAGEIEGLGCLVIGIKDAIRLGGTLIMLPDSDLEEVVGREEYGGETEDSFGEIANIITGSYTKMFEEMYSKSFRFIRKDQQIIVPSKVEGAGDKPVPDQYYYQVSSAMKMEGRQMGEIHMLIPAEPFGLQPEEPLQAQGDLAAQPDTAVVGRMDASVNTSPVPVEEPPASQAPPPPSATAAKKNTDTAKHQARIDKLLKVCEKKLTEELSSLIGVGVKLSGVTNRLISKEELFFEELLGKHVVADMEVLGDDLQARCYFLASLRDSIRLGGILIMLPPNELENVVGDEEFGDDVKDAYGEVANIASGVYTSVFEEQYTEKFRFVKKGLQQVVPLKVEINSDIPVPDQLYYLSSMALEVDGLVLGKMRMLFPAGLLSLEQPAQPAAAAIPAPAPVEQPPSASPQPTEPEAAAYPGAAAATPVRDSGFDFEKHRKRVDNLLKECGKKIQEEVSALLGTDILLAEMENRHISKEEFFFDVANGKQVITDLDVVGELKSRSYLCVSLKDAIYMGGVLIMLPPTELEAVVIDEEFGDDTRDAYSEITNIIAGVYTAVFEEQYSQKIRFIKNELGLVVPMKVDVESDEPIPDIGYYMSSMSLSIEGEKHGRVHLLFPAAMLQLDALPRADAGQPDIALTRGAITGAAPRPSAGGADRARAIAGEVHRPIDILVISDDEAEAAKLASVAEARGFAIRQVSFKDNIKAAITAELRAVYIVMREVNEQAFGMAIKISSSCSLPLIAAGPDWTRSKVIKAVKYGVSDILLTPAAREDIQENLENNLVQMAA